MHRFCVVGNSGSGKTRLARSLADRLGVPHLELDALNHRSGWREAPDDEFRAQVRQAVEEFEGSHRGWVVDGNYRSRIADVLHPDTYVWLDYPRRVVFPRIVRRTLGRVLLRRELWNGNREQWRNLLSPDPMKNILVWSWTQHDNCRRAYERASSADTAARWIRLQTPREAERWLGSLGESHPRETLRALPR